MAVPISCKAFSHAAAAAVLLFSATAYTQEGWQGSAFEHVRHALLEGQAADGLRPAMANEVLRMRLDGAQIRSLLSGNTLRRNDRLAIYFAPDGSGVAWGTDWTRDSSAHGRGACPAVAVPGDDYDLRSGTCLRKSVYELPHAWWVDSDRLCQKWVEAGVPKNECWQVAVLLERVLLLKVDGQIEGLPLDLRAGKVLTQSSD